MLSIYPSVSEKNNKLGLFFSILNELFHHTVVPFSSARAALIFSLRGIGVGRQDDVLVPPFLSHCVISSLAMTCWPVKKNTNNIKALFVYHQFGFPQRIDIIQKEAKYNGWIVINNCVNALFSQYQNQKLVSWGDMVIMSFPKIYPCNLGGGLISHNENIDNYIEKHYASLAESQAEMVSKTYDKLLNLRNCSEGISKYCQVLGIYGYLPELIPFPKQAHSCLPDTSNEIYTDIIRRKRILRIVSDMFPDRVPLLFDEDVVPFAVPIKCNTNKIDQIAEKIKRTVHVEVPILHFDFARNMLKPDYQKAFIIGCHQEWTEEIVVHTCNTIKNML